MILDHKDNLAAFRTALRTWLAETLPADWPERMSAAEPNGYADFQRWWMSERRKVGLVTPTWPVDYGGAGLGLEHEVIIAEEFARANTPPTGMYLIAMTHVPATLMAWGNEDQKRRYLPGVANGTVWCQGFSEPNAGSDLASLRTRAVRDGDAYVVNGQKIWSSSAMYADYCILLARTDPDAPKHRGISFFLLDMKAPGVEVRPIRQATGEAHFAEIFLNDVRIPAEDLVGRENKGWTVSQSTLAAERGVIAFEAAERRRYAFEKRLRQALDRGEAWLGDDQLRREFMQLFAEMQAGRRQIRALLDESRSRGGIQTPMLPAYVKLSATTLMRRFGDLLVRLDGVQSQFCEEGKGVGSQDAMFEYLSSFAQTIAAGTNEIMRNLIAERALELPKS